jgi:hypothetical protein
MGLKYSADYSDTNDAVYLSGRVTVTAVGVEAKVGASPADGRQFVTIYNDGTQTVFFGPSGLATTEMEPLKKKQRVEIAATDLLTITLKTASGTSEVIIQEIG